MLDYQALKNTALNTAPYDYLVLEKFVEPSYFDNVSNDFPEIPGAGSFPPSQLQIKGAFKQLMEALDGPEFRKIISEKFQTNLDEYPTMYTVRGRCAPHNGQIHCDSASKIVTVLLYLNDASWGEDGGRLRVLNSPDSLDDYAEEINPNWGTLLVFRCTKESWHGHKSYDGVRRVIQMNWVLSDDVVKKEQRRHSISAKLKKFTSIFKSDYSSGD